MLSEALINLNKGFFLSLFVILNGTELLYVERLIFDDPTYLVLDFFLFFSDSS
jgi:hypothetical protein